MNIYPKIKGAVDSWELIVAGHLRWNRYFGESEDKPPRGAPSTCSSVLISGTAENGTVYRLMVDPTLRNDAAEYDFDINRRTGLHIKDITHCFATHHHADHFEAFEDLPDAVWYAPEAVKKLITEQNAKLGEKIIAVDGEFLPGVFALPLPGHCKDIHGAAFAYNNTHILVAGDAVMTKYHFRDERTEFQNDPELIAQAAQTIRDIKESFDLIIPGHDNIIVNI